MKKIGFLFFFLTFAVCMGAQTASIGNVWSEVQDQQIAVHYTLATNHPVDVILQYSMDGYTWYYCKSVTGDLLAQTAGSKTILWDCQREGFEKGSFWFKVVSYQSPTHKKLKH